MRRKIMLTAALMIVMMLAACKKTKEITVDETMITPAPPTAAATPTVQPVKTDIDQITKQPEKIEEADQNNDLDQNSDTGAVLSYDLAESSYFNDDKIKIYYPKITGMEDKDYQSKINDTIKEAALIYADGFDTTDSNNLLENDYVVKWKGSRLLSILFIGYYNNSGTAYPTSFSYTLNINMVTGERVKLSDMFQINDNFLQTLEQKASLVHYYFQGDRKLLQDESFQDKAVQSSITDYVFHGDSSVNFATADEDKAVGVQSYYTKDTLGICIDTVHALGDYIQLELNYSDIKDSLIIDQALWKDINEAAALSEIVTKNKTFFEINENQILKNIHYVPNFSIIKDQCFQTEFEKWGEVFFVAGSGEGDSGLTSLYLYLVDQNNNILYELPSFYGNGMMFDGMKAVAFRDVNSDGLKDVIVIADYMTGVGADGAKSFPVAGVYFQQEGKFINVPDMDYEINSDGQNENIDMVVNYLKDADISLE